MSSRVGGRWPGRWRRRDASIRIRASDGNSWRWCWRSSGIGGHLSWGWFRRGLWSWLRSAGGWSRRGIRQGDWRWQRRNAGLQRQRNWAWLRFRARQRARTGLWVRQRIREPRNRLSVGIGNLRDWGWNAGNWNRDRDRVRAWFRWRSGAWHRSARRWGSRWSEGARRNDRARNPRSRVRPGWLGWGSRR